MNFICLFVAWSLSVSIFATFVIYCVKGYQQIRRLHSIPCSKCQYFTDSYYLKCTIHPGLACSEGAIDCRDFLSHSPTAPHKLANKQAFVHHL
jgi:hypothetical protein